MKIAMLHPDLPGSTKGGVAHQVSRLADVLARRGHEVMVVSFTPGPPGVAYRVHRIRAPGLVSRTRAGMLVGAPLAFALRSYRGFDVVHVHGDSYLLRRQRVPTVRTFCGSAREEARHAERLRRKAVQRLLFAGERAARRLATVTVGISENTETSVGSLDALIPCGVDRVLFCPGPKSVHPSVLFVGTLEGRKRGRLVVEVFRDCIRPHVPDCELWLVSDQAAAGEGVRSFGSVSDSDLARLYREAWIVTLPSTYEGFGVPYVEAMASGTAVVATPNAGARELLGPGTGGILVDDGELGAAIIQILQDPARRVELERDGLAASVRFGWEHVAARYEEIYRLAIARAGRSAPCTPAPEEGLRT